MDINEARRLAADFYKKVKGLRTAYPKNMSYELTTHYLVIADHESINDKSEEYEVPAEYYVLPLTDLTNYLHIKCYNKHGEGPVFIVDDENAILESEDRKGKIRRKIADEIYNAIINIAEEFTIDRCEDVEMVMISPGYEAVLWSVNGDPGYPAEPAEYEGACPHCGNTIIDTESHYRCESCKKFYRTTYSDNDW